MPVYGSVCHDSSAETALSSKLLSSEDIRAEQAEAYGYVSKSRPAGRRAGVRYVEVARDADRQVR